MSDEQTPQPEETNDPEVEAVTDGEDAVDATPHAFADALLAEQLEATIADRDENYQRFLKASAEVENVRRRSRADMEELRKYQAGPLATELLMPLDNLKRAIEAAQSGEGDKNLLAGLTMVVGQFEQALASHGVTKIEAVGQTFDPNRHEALQQVPSPDHEPMAVLQEVESGYMIADRVLRPSKVIVVAE